MKPELRFEMLHIRRSYLKDSPVPALVGGKVLQNSVLFQLGEDEELYEGYGTRETSYPYVQQDGYTRKLHQHEERTAILENDFLRAVFLPDLGGRLWRLEDKTNGRNLLYTNDVIRFSNLAGCNAWFSGGVEWNIGIIGHSPFTNRSLYCATLQAPEGWPVLRMYEYERVRGVEWQMDFWLRPDSRALNCRMRVTNCGTEVVPMYWWSNIAVPEFEGGRIVMPADFAYRYTLNETGRGMVDKVKIPYVDGVDITHYGNIEKQADYFFDLFRDGPKYIANIDAEGFGLMQLSTQRLRSRKLFSWGKNTGSNNWQRFLTDEAGRYVEIQAGLAKTQYGCIPMPPHTAWEWMEQYGPVQLNPVQDWESLRKQATQAACERLEAENLEDQIQQTRAMALTPALCQVQGSPYSVFCRNLRADAKNSMASHLDYGVCRGPMKDWEKFMQTGVLHCPDPEQEPDAFFCEEEVLKHLQRTEIQNDGNWYAAYQLGIMLLVRGDWDGALRRLEKSAAISDNAWNAHALACLHLRRGNKAVSARYMEHGCALRLHDLSYQKEGLRLLLLAGDGDAILRLIARMPEEVRQDSRIRYDEAQALVLTGKKAEAFALLNENGGLVPDDVREGDDSLECMWRELADWLGKSDPIPEQMCFRSL